MSKSSTASAPKIPTQLPHKSAWSRGPPQSTSNAPTPRSQSPAPGNATPPASATHSRRPSALGQGVSFKDGVAGARSPVNTVKSGSAVTFGSIDDASAPISSSPASVPPIKTEGVKSFGSVPATPSSAPTVNGKIPSTSSTTKLSSTSTTAAVKPAMGKMDVRKLFQTPSSGPVPSSSSQPTSDVSSPSTRPSPLPSHSAPPSQPSHGQSSSHHSQPSQFGSQSYTPFVPGAGLRPQQNGANNNVPRSPVYPRQGPNGVPNVNGRPSGAPGGPAAAPSPMSTGMPSPRMGPHPVPPAMSPGQPVVWPGYYYSYPGMPEYQMPYSPQWPTMMPHGVPPQQQQQPQGPPGQSHPGMPMSPRNPPPQLHAPGTPTLAPAVPAPGHPPHSAPSPHMHTSSLSSVTSPPSTPSSSTGAGAAGLRMDRNAIPFIPRKVVIKNESGQEVHFDSLKRQSGLTPASPVVVPSSPARRAPIRIETEEAMQKRLAAEERVKKEAEDKVKREAEEKQRKQREEEEKKKKDAEEAERVKKEAEKERLKKEEEEKERLRKEEEERQEQSRKAEEEKERVRKEEEERLRKEAEEKERAQKEAAEKEKAALALVESTATTKEVPEEGEVDEVEEAKDTFKEETKEKSQEKAPLRIDTAVPSLDVVKKRPGPLDLSSTKQTIVAPLPSALATARNIDDLNAVQYPEGIKSPLIELNINARDGKFRYDREFLLQFMQICKEKPDSLPALDAIGLEPSDQSYAMTRGGSGRRQSSLSMGPPPSAAARQASVGLGISGFAKPVANPFTMGQFATQGGKMSSEERFALANRSASMSGGPVAGMPFGRQTPMVRSSSQGGAGTPMSHRTRSKRGEKRGDSNKPGGAGPSGYSSYNAMAQAGMSLEPVAPLELSANRWTPQSVSKKVPTQDETSPALVDRKVKGLLNKLTMERFDSISDQIIAWANKSEAEKDGRTLIQVIRLVFEKATDEATWSEMYARLCRKMMEQISSKVQDDGIRNNEGKPITGGHLFRKYLLNRCQEDFERGWVAQEAAAAAAATKATEDQAAKAAAENNKDGESALYSEEYYIAQKAKRQGLGLIKFIGELFKLQMLTERIMHECVKKLLGNVDNPEEEEIESLCKLLSTVGQLLDTPKARAHMDVYFSRMKELTKSTNVNSRMQFMLQDVIELRERKWIPRNQVAAPTTIAAVHEAAAKEKAAAEKDSHRNISMSRGGSRRGGDRGDHTQVGPDGWAVAGTAPRAPPKAGDLSNFGKITKTTSMSFGPSSVFSGKKTESKRESTLSRTSSSNMFSMLSQNPELAVEATAALKSSRPPSRKGSIDLGHGGVPEAPLQRKRLNLLPRSVPKAEETPAGSVAGSEDEGAENGSAAMSEEEAKKRIQEDSKEFFSVRDLDEAEVYFTKLPVEHRHRLVDKLISSAIEEKESDAQLVADLFARAVSKNLCSPATFEEGFNPTAEILDDIVVDAPKALSLFAIMIKGAGLDKDEERRTRLASKSMDSDKLLGLLS